MPAKQIKRAVDSGACRINSRVERFGSKLVGYGDRIEFDFAEQTVPPILEDRFLYVDEEIIAYNKPAGQASDDKKLLNEVHKSYPDAILLHRLDRDTTGVLLFAKNAIIAEQMENLFKQRKIDKTYLAIVDGAPAHASGTIENCLGKLHTYQGQSLWGEVPKGLWAKTKWATTKKQKEAALLTCYPETGRTHQIRVHLSGIGHPILGDHQYGRNYRCAYRPPRLLLHAAEIAFLHPKTNQRLVIKAPLPADFKQALQDLNL